MSEERLDARPVRSGTDPAVLTRRAATVCAIGVCVWLLGSWAIPTDSGIVPGSLRPDPRAEWTEFTHALGDAIASACAEDPDRVVVVTDADFAVPDLLESSRSLSPSCRFVRPAAATPLARRDLHGAVLIDELAGRPGARVAMKLEPRPGVSCARKSVFRSSRGAFAFGVYECGSTP